MGSDVSPPVISENNNQGKTAAIDEAVDNLPAKLKKDSWN